MGFEPLRQKRFEYVKSDIVYPSDPAHAHAGGKKFDLANILENIFYPKAEAEKRENQPNYLVKLEEKDESDKPWYKKQGKVTGLEKFSGRDYAIGAQLGGLIGTFSSLATGGMAAPVIAGMALVGAAIGGVNEYINNSNEIKDRALITPPTHFNRDCVNYSLGWAVAAKVALTLAAAVLPQVGIVLAVPEIVTTIVMACGAIYGAKKGADAGYDRMDQDYQNATIKHQRPELGVSKLVNEPSIIEELAPALALTVAPTLNKESNLAQTSAKSEESTKWRDMHPSRKQNGFVDIANEPVQTFSHSH